MGLKKKTEDEELKIGGEKKMERVCSVTRILLLSLRCCEGAEWEFGLGLLIVPGAWNSVGPKALQIVLYRALLGVTLLPHRATN